MSACNEYAEFLATLCLETGARPHLVAPLARRLRRLATRHTRLCETDCNGCRRCDGSGVPHYSSPIWSSARYATAAAREQHGDPPCPGCSTGTVERAIEATCEELAKLAENRDGEWRGRPFPFPVSSLTGEFVPTFQGDPRGATVRLRVPSGASGDWGGVVVPTSRV